MKTKDVMAARIYLTEASPLVNEVLLYLNQKANIRGISIFRAISGFGDSGHHSSSFLDLSLELPIAIDFVDSKEKMLSAIEHLSTVVKAEHIIFWDVKTTV
jgi:PII-like signaling protein